MELLLCQQKIQKEKEKKRDRDNEFKKKYTKQTYFDQIRNNTSIKINNDDNALVLNATG